MATQYRAEILNVHVPLKHRLGEISEWSHDANHECNCDPIGEAIPSAALQTNQDDNCKRSDSAANQSLN
ncbi:unannotated protein [freshwater metagenome]|uniref:Unannotated protein n=1 Tax=freshwater metagenome TaxID=449393 RepID=A0A6J6K4U9_9ZZZZ